MPFHFFDPMAPVAITRRNLPHWEQRDAYYFIPFRTPDSFPREVLEWWLSERNVWLVQHGIDHAQADWQRDLEMLPAMEHRECYRTFANKWHENLDRGHGECLLRRPELSGIVAENFGHFDGDRYELNSFVVMPNHVHVLRGIAGRGTMRTQCRNWKKFTATKITERLRRSGQFRVLPRLPGG